VILVDTSVWIESFRRGSSFRLEDVIELEEVVTCLPVIQEVLQGFDDQVAYEIAREAMLSFPRVEFPIGEEVFQGAVDLYRRARRTGLTVRSSTDCLIAACAIRHSLAVCHRDRDYDAIAEVSSLEVVRV
jgi:predicted nucleic acid-binding protein